MKDLTSVVEKLEAVAAFRMKPPRLDQCTKETLIAYFERTWAIYEWLFSSINADKHFFISPDPLRNPMIFYYGHTAAFYINKLKVAGLIPVGIDAKYDQLFAVGVDPAQAEELANQPTWPTVNFVREYRQKAKAIVLEFLHTHSFPAVILPENPEWAILMGLEHDRIHFETSSVLIRQMPAELLSKPLGWMYADHNVGDVSDEWAAIEGGKVSIGQPSPPQFYAWDNEIGHLEKVVAPFAVRKTQITNGEFLDFVMDDGYENETFWSEKSWAWLQAQAHRAPRFWVQNGIGYRFRAMFDEMEMPLDWPVEVNCFEAEAYCKWAGEGHRLMTEAEWRLLANDALTTADPIAADDNFNLHVNFGSPCPAAVLKPQGKLGLKDIFGNVWDWISDDFYPLPGFETHPYYEEFSAPYFDSDHGMMMGGSWATTGTGASRHYRLWFRHNFMQHAGFRLAKSNV